MDNPNRCPVRIPPHFPAEVPAAPVPRVALRPEIHDDSAGIEHAVRFAQGIDHAPFGDASQRPGEEHDVEGARPEGERFRRSYLEADAAAQQAGGEGPRARDLIGIRVDPNDPTGGAQDPARQPSVAAPYVEHAGASEGRTPQE
jgi:hypothetical protein